jgi:hypothetical protein
LLAQVVVAALILMAVAAVGAAPVEFYILLLVIDKLL